jgi:hypothetical protein
VFHVEADRVYAEVTTHFLEKVRGGFCPQTAPSRQPTRDS